MILKIILSKGYRKLNIKVMNIDIKRTVPPMTSMRGFSKAKRGMKLLVHYLIKVSRFFFFLIADFVRFLIDYR